MHSVTRSDVEDFLFAEADLLDQWRPAEWLTLFTDDAKYEVPLPDLPPDASPDSNLFYIADDRVRLGERVKRLMKRTRTPNFPIRRQAGSSATYKSTREAMRKWKSVAYSRRSGPRTAPPICISGRAITG